MMGESRHVMGQVLRFGVVGVINTLVDFGILNLLVKVFDFAPVWANSVSFSVAVLTSYLFNKYWTFSDHAPAHLRQFPIFVVVSVVGLIASSLLVHYGTQILLSQTVYPLSFTMSYNLAKAISAMMVLVWNFTAYKFLVFKR